VTLESRRGPEENVSRKKERCQNGISQGVAADAAGPVWDKRVGGRKKKEKNKARVQELPGCFEWLGTKSKRKKEIQTGAKAIPKKKKAGKEKKEKKCIPLRARAYDHEDRGTKALPLDRPGEKKTQGKGKNTSGRKKAKGEGERRDCQPTEEIHIRKESREEKYMGQ